VEEGKGRGISRDVEEGKGWGISRDVELLPSIEHGSTDGKVGWRWVNLNVQKSYAGGGDWGDYDYDSI
jgi:hypothetical protein